MNRIAVLVLLLAACGGGATGDDAGPDAASADGGADAGARDAGADAGSDAGATDLGTEAGTADAGGDAACATDADGDGHVSLACGGDDCDDSDPGVYTGHAEVCDALGRDEDCDPATLGPDGDGDGAVSTACCDRQPGGALLCGTDCDDTRATVNPTAAETCNGIDDDCDGMIDEGVTTLYFPDCDRDGFGASGDPGMAACAAPSSSPASCTAGLWATVATDCDDASVNTHPGATERCNYVDDDCNGSIDDGVTCPVSCADLCSDLAALPDTCTPSYGGMSAILCPRLCAAFGWAAGTWGDTSGDTIACRTTAAHVAATDPDPARVMGACFAASVQGGTICGPSLCDDFCDEDLAVCPTAYADHATCVTACTAWPIGTAGDSTGDSFACREYHLFAAALGDATTRATECPRTDATGADACH